MRTSYSAARAHRPSRAREGEAADRGAHRPEEGERVHQPQGRGTRRREQQEEEGKVGAQVLSTTENNLYLGFSVGVSLIV